MNALSEQEAPVKNMKKRIAKLAADADTGNLQKMSLAYGRVLEACVSCHNRYRD